MNEFEKRIADTPPNRLPAEWRDGILRAARSEMAPDAVRPALPPLPWWLEWLWPSPAAWSTLAAAWALIFALHALTPAASTAQASPGSDNTLNLLVKRQQELAGLLATADEPAAPKAVGPRSELPTDRPTGRGDFRVVPLTAAPTAITIIS